MSGVLDGQSLTRFTPGLTYVVRDAFGHQLIAMKGALEDTSNGPAITIHAINADGTQLTDGIVVIPPEDVPD